MSAALPQIPEALAVPVGPRSGLFVRLLSSAVASQAALSAASLLVGLMLIRHTSDVQYGLYVLVFNGILLLTSLQTAFFAPAMVIRMTPLDREGRGEVVGGLYREQRRMLRPLVWLALAAVVALRLSGTIDDATTVLLVLATLAGRAVLKREFFRTSLMAHRRAHDVLRGDMLYVLLLVAGVVTAVWLPLPAAATIAAMGVAALAASLWLSRALRRNEAWDPTGQPGILRAIAPGAAWVTGGAAIHWLVSQGYSFIVAATLDVTAVAALAATRLLLMPVNLVSTGVGSLMLPLTAGWLREHDARAVFQRLAGVAGALVAGAAFYLVLMWLSRDWVFTTLFNRQFVQADVLIELWAIIAILMVLRDQLLYLLLARARFRRLTALTALSATVSLAVTYWGMLHYGVPGALLGVLSGELASVVGIVLMSLYEIGRLPAVHPAPSLQT